MLLKPLVCTCNKRFKTNPAMLQHQRDSPAHTKQQAEPSRDLNDLFHGLTLQSQEADRTFERQEATYNFIPFEEPAPRDCSTDGGVTPTPMQGASANTGSSMLAYKNAASTTKPKTKKKTTNLSTYNATSSTTRHTVFETSNEGWDVSAQFYGLCDKDCGWCGHCADGVDF